MVYRNCNKKISSILYNCYTSIAEMIGESNTELDSQASMPVFGCNCYVFDSIQNKACTVEPFDSTIGDATEAPIVDTSLLYH